MDETIARMLVKCGIPITWTARGGFAVVSITPAQKITFEHRIKLEVQRVQLIEETEKTFAA